METYAERQKEITHCCFLLDFPKEGAWQRISQSLIPTHRTISSHMLKTLPDHGSRFSATLCKIQLILQDNDVFVYAFGSSCLTNYWGQYLKLVIVNLGKSF